MLADGVRLRAARVMRYGPAWRLAGIAGALLLAAASMLAWFADPAAVFGLQGALWLASMGVLLAACARWHPSAGGAANPELPWSRIEAGLFIGLVILALVTYTFDLNDIPWRFHGDEATAYQEALRYYQGPAISLFTTTWYGTSLPSLPFAFAGGLMRLVGANLGGSRLGVALCGAWTVIPTYGLARLAWGRTAAVLAAFALATTPVAIHYSRVSIDNMTTAFAWAVCFYFLLRGLRSARPGDFVWAGLTAGLSMYTYYGTRLLPYLLLAFGGYLAVFHFRAFRARLGLLALVPAGFVAGFGPLLAYFVRYPDQWLGRGMSELVVLTVPTSVHDLVADVQALAPLLRLNVLGVSTIPSHDAVYWAPLLMPVQAALLGLGVVCLLLGWRQPEAALVLLWLGGVFFLAGLLLAQSLIPDFAHWVPAFPALFVAQSIPLAWALHALRRAWPRLWPAGAGVVAAGMIAIAAINGYTYLVIYPTTVPPAFESAQGRFLATLGPSAHAYFLGNSWIPFWSTVGQMLAPAVPAADLLNPGRALPLAGDTAQERVFVFNADEVQYLPLVQSYYPGGQARPISTPGGPIGQTYRVGPAQAASRYGVLLTLTGAGNAPGWQGQVPAVGALPPDVRASYPLTATWSGAFFGAGADPVRLHLQGATAATLRVLDAPAAFDTPLALDAGWTPFTIATRLAGPASIRLLRQEGVGVAAPIDNRQLWPQAPGSGLAVTLNGATVTHRIDATIGAGVLGTGAVSGTVGVPAALAARDPDFVPLAPLRGGGTQIRWMGEVYAEGGVYTMELRTDAHAFLAIDGARLIDLCANVPIGAPDVPIRDGYPSFRAPVELAPGWHPVALALDAMGRTNGLEWTWTRPDGGREIVPPARLRHTIGAWPPPPTPITCAP